MVLLNAHTIAKHDCRNDMILHDIVASAEASGYTVPQWAREEPLSWGEITETRFTTVEFVSRPWYLNDVSDDLWKAMVDHDAEPLKADEIKMSALAFVNKMRTKPREVWMQELGYDGPFCNVPEETIERKLRQYKEDVDRLHAQIASGSSLFDNPSQSPRIPNGHKDFAKLVMSARHPRTDYFISRPAMDLLREIYDAVAFGHMSRSPAPLPQYMASEDCVKTPYTDKEANLQFVSSTGVRVSMHHTFGPFEDDGEDDDDDGEDDDFIPSSDTDAGDEISSDGDDFLEDESYLQAFEFLNDFVDIVDDEYETVLAEIGRLKMKLSLTKRAAGRAENASSNTLLMATVTDLEKDIKKLEAEEETLRSQIEKDYETMQTSRSPPRTMAWSMGWEPHNDGA